MKKFLHISILTLAYLFFINIGYAQTTYTVTSTSKDGPGSFIEAVGFANANPGADIIEFTPGLQVDASYAVSINPGDYMANITESVIIDGKGGALNGFQKWISSDGTVNSLNFCPASIASTIILHEMPNFLEIGIAGVDNSTIEVTVKDLSIKQFNGIANVRKNASLTLEDFKADEIWSTLICGATDILSTSEGGSLTLKNSEITNSQTWEGVPIISGDASDLTIEECFFYNINNRKQYLVFWNGQTGSEVNIVSSRFMLSGGIFIDGNVSTSNIVNSSWVNEDTSIPYAGDRIVNNAIGDMNIIASTFMWNSNVCSTCQDYLFESKVGKINFIESAVGINYPGSASDNLNTLGGTGTGFTADLYTWIQPTTSQDAATLKTITSQPNLLTGADAFNTPITSSSTYFDIELITPNVSGDLIDRISTPLINPITSSEITTDVFGNDRKDANGRRDIGAVQLGLAPLLSLVAVNDQSVDLSWNEPSHHGGLPILRYEVSYVEPLGFPTIVTVNLPNLTTTINSLTNGIEYEFSVRAVYNNGGTEIDGPYSNAVFGTPYGDFETPDFDAVPGDEQVTLNWSLPDLGGRSFESYVILWRVDGTTQYTGGTAILDANQTSTIINGLVNNTTYEFALRVKASNEFSSDVFATATPYTLDWNVVPTDLTVECDGAGNITDFEAWLNTTFSGSGTCGLLTVTNNSTGLSDDCGETGSETVTFTLTDDCGNFIEQDATFMIEDTTPALIGCTSDIIALTEDGDCGAVVVFPNAIALEDCGDVFVSQTAGLASGSVFPVGATLIEFTALDSCGNISTCDFTITVEDDDAPDAICQSITVELDDMGNASITANDIDFGSNDNCGVVTLAIDLDTFDCSHVGDNDVILTVTDLSANSATCVAVVTVVDVTAPEVICNDITVELDASGSVTIDPMIVGAGSSDACGIASYELNIGTFDCSNIGESTVILSVTDVNGNESSCSATITVEDNIAPELVCMDVTLELNQDGIAYIIPSELVDINDPCGVAVITADVDEVTCADIGTPVEVNVFANDGNGNNSFCSFMVTVVDVLGPQIVCPPNEAVNLDPDGTYTLGDYIGDGIATASDNCTDPVTIFSQDPVPGTTLGFGIQVITFTAEDEYGNISTCSFDLDVQGILGSNDLELGSLLLYPNPTDNYVYLSNPNHLELYDVSIYDVTGRLINKIDLSNMSEEETIDVSNFASATYMLIIKGANGITTKQLIVE